MTLPRTFFHVAVAAVLAIGLNGCGGDDGATVRQVEGEGATGTGSGASGTGGGSGTGSGTPAGCQPVGDPRTAQSQVQVALAEWSVSPVPAQVAAGRVAFMARNAGQQPHELVVVRAQRADDLPVAPNGAVDENRLPDGALIGEIGPFPPGQNCTGVFTLQPGSYVLLCNIVSNRNGRPEAHFAMGMSAPFTVS